MDARVNQSSRYGTITAFSGREYVKYEWRVVPAGFEAEAARHPYLEVKPVEVESEPQPEPPVALIEEVKFEPVPEPVAEPAKQPRKRR
jgi:hypothetical protein